MPDALRFLLLGLFDGGLEFGSELEIVLQNVIKQNAKLRELSPRKLVQLGFDFFDLAHALNSRSAKEIRKYKVVDLRPPIRGIRVIRG